MSTLFGLSHNPEKYEARALKYEQKGKTQKAIKNREKAAKLRAAHPTAGAVPMHTTTTTTPVLVGGNTTAPFVQRTPARYEQNALKWEQRGNWNKAQKNREKVWRLNNPQYANVTQYPAPTFYNNNKFVGYNMPYTQGQTITTQTTQTAFIPSTYKASPFSQFGSSRRDPARYEAKALEYESKGKTKKALKLREKANRIRANNGQYTTTRTPALYEQNALKWEQRGNWNKAQKNREKVWRLQNPQYMNVAQYPAPAFYQQNRFVGYNLPYTYGGAHAGLAQPATIHHMNAPIVETHVRPTIVEQTARPEKIVEVQPIIHREVEAPQVRVIEKHIYETVPSTGPALITKQAIVEETVKPRIIEEIQPVVHREVPAPFVERVEQHVTEHITRPVVSTKEVVNGGAAMAVPAGGIAQTTTTTTTTQKRL